MSKVTGGPFIALFWSALGQQTIKDGSPVLEARVTGGPFPLLFWSALGQQPMIGGTPTPPVSNFAPSGLWFFRSRRKLR